MTWNRVLNICLNINLHKHDVNENLRNLSAGLSVMCPGYLTEQNRTKIQSNSIERLVIWLYQLS